MMIINLSLFISSSSSRVHFAGLANNCSSSSPSRCYHRRIGRLSTDSIDYTASHCGGVARANGSTALLGLSLKFF